jgi:MurNAc alpha-1-phosphate uridylyltransferase
VLCVGYKWQMIRDFVGDGARFGVQVIYSVDQPKLLGTGGALRHALPHLGPEFLVMYGDSWLDTVYAPIVAAFRQSGKPALMTVFRNDGQWDRSNVWFENNELRRYDKRERLAQMRHIDWGLSLATAALVAEKPADTAFDLADTYTELSRRGELAGYEVGTRFYEIGSIEGLRETDALLRASHSSAR